MPAPYADRSHIAELLQLLLPSAGAFSNCASITVIPARSLSMPSGIQRHQLAVIDNRDVVTKAVRFVHVVSADEIRELPVLLRCSPASPHGHTRNRVEAGGRLIQKKYFRMMNQAARNLQPAPHPAGKRFGCRIAPLRQVHEFQQLCDRLRRSFAGTS